MTLEDLRAQIEVLRNSIGGGRLLSRFQRLQPQGQAMSGESPLQAEPPPSPEVSPRPRLDPDLNSILRQRVQGFGEAPWRRLAGILIDRIEGSTLLPELRVRPKAREEGRSEAPPRPQTSFILTEGRHPREKPAERETMRFIG